MKRQNRLEGVQHGSSDENYYEKEELLGHLDDISSLLLQCFAASTILYPFFERTRILPLFSPH
jgi:hypothetical protein